MRRRLMAARHGYACGNELKTAHRRNTVQGRKVGTLKKRRGRKANAKMSKSLKRMTPREATIATGAPPATAHQLNEHGGHNAESSPRLSKDAAR